MLLLQYACFGDAILVIASCASIVQARFPVSLSTQRRVVDSY